MGGDHPKRTHGHAALGVVYLHRRARAGFFEKQPRPNHGRCWIWGQKIVVWDHNRDLITHRANTIFDDPDAAKYAWGTGFHWYETWTGGNPKYENLKLIKEAYPDKQLLFTEGCQEGFDAAHYERWSNAERYGNSMINDFNSGTVGWTDWNILLDETGGPNHVQNLCFAPIHADNQKDSLIFTPTYYYIGHFSKFIEPGALRVSTSASRSTIESTTFQNPDGSLVTVVMNRTDEALDYTLVVEDQEVRTSIPAHAMQTLVSNCPYCTTTVRAAAPSIVTTYAPFGTRGTHCIAGSIVCCNTGRPYTDHNVTLIGRLVVLRNVRPDGGSW